MYIRFLWTLLVLSFNSHQTFGLVSKCNSLASTRALKFYTAMPIYLGSGKAVSTVLVVLLLLNAQHVLGWHGYNYTYSRMEDRSECPSFEEATRPYSSDFIEELGLWPNTMSHFDVEHGESLYGSKEGLEMIWKNQNPEDCSKAKFLVSGGWPYGFGSRIHMEGAVMGMALHLGRVYLPHPDGDNFFWETSTSFCRSRNEPGMNCFYMPFSKCTIQDATANVGGNVNNLRTYHMGDFRAAFEDLEGLEQMVSSLESMQGINLVMTVGGGKYDLHKYIPHQVRPLIDCSPMREHADYYWWRAVSATFVARPNKPTLALLAQHTTLPIQDFSDTVSMFVRHGDKGIEMKLLDFTEYVRVAQMMWDRGMVPQSARYLRAKLAAMETPAESPSRTRLRRRRALAARHLASSNNATGQISGPNLYRAAVPTTGVVAAQGRALPAVPYNGTIFLTTEDPAVIQQANEWGAANHWSVTYTNLFDRSLQTAVKTWDEQHKKGAPQVHDKLEYISMMLNLYYSLRSEAYVCTLASNSCRIIDEMRATLGGKANRFYADLSIETCARPPCLDEDDPILSFAE